MILQQSKDEVQIRLEIDRKGGFLSEMTDLDETKDSLTYKGGSQEDLKSQLKERIERNM